MEKICPKCGTVNEDDYTYCKNCGTALPDVKTAPTEAAASGDGEEIACRSCQTLNSKNFNFCRRCGTPLYETEDTAAETLDGVPTDDLVAFVGKNGQHIVGKWKKAEAGGNRFIFCWPVAILMAFFGIAGAGFWFLYRRMYKIGIILLSAALVSAVVAGALLVPIVTEVSNELIENNEFGAIVSEYYQTGNYLRYTEQLARFLEKSPQLMGQMMRLEGVMNIFSILETVFLIILGFSALRLYKSFAFKKLRQFTQKPTELELSLSGGT